MSIFLHNLSPSPLWYLLVWSPAPHTPYISLPNQCLLFATHAHTIAACFGVVPRLYHLFPVSLSQVFTCNFIFYLNITQPSESDHSHLCSLKCHLIFFANRPGITSRISFTICFAIQKISFWCSDMGKAIKKN